MIIAIDFDGTIAEVNVENGLPIKIGEPLPQAKEVINELYLSGHELLLWTCRTNILHLEKWYLMDAIKWLANHEILHCFSKFNEQSQIWIEHDIWGQVNGRKLYADVYIDDKNIGGFPGWGEVRKLLL